ncbi:hypothetical protein ACH5RR_008747 [Cinchona calisaya]|uniref:Uncharacterized protein n=1 Tax=Cinchona calisaya TaxID=153742 RepID=A0ABD3AG51_9GENT
MSSPSKDSFNANAPATRADDLDLSGLIMAEGTTCKNVVKKGFNSKSRKDFLTSRMRFFTTTIFFLYFSSRISLALWSLNVEFGPRSEELEEDMLILGLLIELVL